MMKNKQGGKRLLKTAHSKKEYLRRGLSLMLSLCMVVPLLAGTTPSPALARTSTTGDKATENHELAPEVETAETQEEIKARLMRQIREEGWDPYSSDMSMDEFYALMELFQEGSLPLEEDEPVAEKLSGTTIRTPKNEESSADAPDTDAPDTDAPDAGQSEEDDSDAEEPVLGGSFDDGPTQATPDVDTPELDHSAADSVIPGVTRPSHGGKTTAGSATMAAAQTVYVPRSMFLFDGLEPEGKKDSEGNDIPASTPGRDAGGKTFGSPLEYNNNANYEQLNEGEMDETTGGPAEPRYNYPAGLDPYNTYTRPPEGWNGVVVDNKLEAMVIVPGTNDNNVSVSGDVDQSLFLTYDNVYVRRVSAQNNDVNILGAIRLPEQGSYIYYYTNDEKQSTEVSATTLPEGQKFVVHYAHREYPISYTIRIREPGNTFESWKDPATGSESFQAWQATHPDEEPDLADWVRSLEVVDNEEYYTNLIFGTDFPNKTDMGAYAFTATAPDGYTLSFYLSTKRKDINGDGELTWTDAVAASVTYEENGGKPGFYDGVNQGWALGMEPVYEKEQTRLMPNIKKGPQELVTTGTFYNNNVDGERIVAAVLTKKPTPVFNAHSYITAGIDQVAGRGTCGPRFVKGYLRDDADKKEVTIPYDYEDVYLWAKGEAGKESKYIYTNLYTTASTSNISDGNVATVDGWGWNSSPNGKDATAEEAIAKSSTIGKMEKNEEDGTYFFQWTFQTNSGDNQVLDVLELNRVGITIPYYAKNSVTKTPVKGEYPARNETGGIYSWWAETELPDGAIVKVELLMLFATKPQRVYRITVTGARNDVTVTAMNLMQYGAGAQEISAYHLDGITGATTQGTNIRRTAVQFYERSAPSENPPRVEGWTENITKGNIYVNSIDYRKGDENYGGANVRFKLAEGYSNPYFLLESLREGTIEGQASVTRKFDGTVERGDQNPVVPFISNGDDPYMKYYDPATDGNIPGVKPGDPIPVNSEGKVMYYYDSNGNFKPFTDWTTLRVQVDAVSSATWEEEEETKPTPEEGLQRAALQAAANEGEGGEPVPSDFSQERLVPKLYLSENGTGPSGYPLTKSQVIAPNKANTFKWDEGANLKSQYIYSGTGGWYYIRLTTQLDYKIALLTIVAHPTFYVIRYKPQELAEVTDPEGNVLAEAHMPTNMPEFQHSSSCPTFLQVNPNEDDGDDRAEEEFDDNSGFFYDVEVHNAASVSLSRPTDPAGYYQFVDWVLVDEDDVPIRQYVVRDGDWVVDPDNPGTEEHPNYLTQEVHFTSGSIDIRELSELAILNDDLGTTANDIYVLRLVPTWEKIEKPFHYVVALNWVDAQGILHVEYFDDLWQDVLTNYELDENGLTVKVLINSAPFQNWIAQHPTYTFWDPVNNAMDGFLYDKNDPLHKDPDSWAFLALDEDEWSAEETIRYMLFLYFPPPDEGVGQEEMEAWQKSYNAALAAILNRDRAGSEDGDDFDVQGNYTYRIWEDNGTIALWMYEDKGGLVFHKDVDPEPFLIDDEFYFTVDEVAVGTLGGTLNGEYKAYPAKAYDPVTGKERTVLASDAWRVKFENGNITNIVKNDGSHWPTTPVTYFTVKNGESIKLFVPEGRYTVTELGSKSGGSYRVEVTYKDDNGNMVPKDEWELPVSDTALYLKGKSKERLGKQNPDGTVTYPDGIYQISATVQFKLGERNMARTITFSNQTTSISYESVVIGPYQNEYFGFATTLILPKGAAPLFHDSNQNGQFDAATDYYYFNFNLYNVKYANGEEPDERPPEPEAPGDEPAGRPVKPTEPVEPDDSNYQDYYPEAEDYTEAYNIWLEAHRQWKRDCEQWELELDAWLRADAYQKWLEKYEAWKVWHDWKPGGTLTPASTGRMVVTQLTQTAETTAAAEDTGDSTFWSAQYLVVPQTTDRNGNVTSWRRVNNGSGIRLRSNQRIYVVCTVPDSGLDINYLVEEADASGYRLEGDELRMGLVRSSDLAYHLFINSRLEGLPATGGPGVKLFQATGSLFLLSGLSLAWMKKPRRRKGRRVAAS